VTVIADPGNRRITAKIPLGTIPGDPTTWSYVVAVMSNDGYGINGVRDVAPEGGQWVVGGADSNPNHTRILDYLWLEGSMPTQEEMLSTYSPDYPQVKLFKP
jgi:carbohydrate-binding DOMON domain-containing protein